jgi:hypothetical protein
MSDEGPLARLLKESDEINLAWRGVAVVNIFAFWLWSNRPTNSDGMPALWTEDGSYAQFPENLWTGIAAPDTMLWILHYLSDCAVSVGLLQRWADPINTSLNAAILAASPATDPVKIENYRSGVVRALSALNARS